MMTLFEDDPESAAGQWVEPAAEKPTVPRIVDLAADQQDVLSRTMWKLMEGKRPVLQMPTGAGKTRTAARLVQLASADTIVWFICHRREIIRQASRNTFDAFGIEHGVISPEHESQPDKRVQVASIQTLRWRSHQYPEPGLIIWDECHHMAAPTWARMMEQYPDAKHVGLTATPERLDGKGLSEWFDELVCGLSIRELTGIGRLSDYRMFVPSVPDLTAARIKAGDYHKEDLDKIMNTPVLIGDALEHYQRIAPGSRALAFAASVPHSKALVEKFNAAGVPARHVDGKTPVDERDAAIADLEAGRIRMLSNYGVFTEGFDLPAIDAVILLRPTRSLTLYLQMVGRGLRPKEGKGKATVLDHAGCYYEHSLPDANWAWSIEGGARKRRIAAMREHGEYTRKCPECLHVHALTAECPECGFEYPMGREVGEFDGSLREANAVPVGCEPISRFARRHRVTNDFVRKWMASGMPNVEGHPRSKEADEWVEQKRHVPDGFDTIAGYGRRRGITKTSIHRMIKSYGMPTLDGKYIPVAEADQWLLERNFKFIPPIGVGDIGDYERPITFARKEGVLSGTLSYWVRLNPDFPVASNGWIHKKRAREWIRSRQSVNKLRVVAGAGEFEPIKAFSKRWRLPHKVAITFLQEIGANRASNGWVEASDRVNREARAKFGARLTRLSRMENLLGEDVGEFVTSSGFVAMLGLRSDSSLISCWEKSGRVVRDGSLVNVKLSLDKLTQNPPKRMPPLFVEDRDAYRNTKDFGAIIGLGESRVRSLKRKGLPCAPNGWVHVRSGLEWVRDNTNIEIPPEAWPKPDAPLESGKVLHLDILRKPAERDDKTPDDEEEDEMPVMGVASWGRK